MKAKKLSFIFVLILCFLMSACGGDTSTANTQSDSFETEASEPVGEETEELYDEEPVEEAEEELITYEEYIRDAIENENYIDAMAALVIWLDEGILPEEEALYDELYSSVVSNTGKDEPMSGTELERTFKYQGGGQVTLIAESGPVEVLIVDIEDESQYVRFYVRQGESAVINIPASIYDITYKQGIVWFDAENGFGDLYYDGYYDDPFDFSSESDNAWITNTHWEITI